LENIALRHQISLLQRQVHKPRLKGQERVFWVILKRTWPKWQTALMIFQPEMVIAPCWAVCIITTSAKRLNRSSQRRARLLAAGP